MSIDAINWVLGNNRRTPGLRGPKNAQRLVLLVIANHANEHGESWPSNSTIEREANVSADTRRDALSWLVERGYVERTVNAEPDTRRRADRRANLYTIRWDVENGPGESTPPSDPTGRENPGTRGGTSSTKPADAPITRTTSEPPPEADPAGQPPELTPDQRARAITDRMFDGIRERTGKPFVGMHYMAVVQLIRPFLASGYTDDEVRGALRVLWQDGAPITRGTVEAQMQGRRRARPTAAGRIEALQALEFTADGSLVNQ